MFFQYSIMPQGAAGLHIEMRRGRCYTSGMKKIIAAVIAAAMLAGLGVCALAAGGADDPLISLSWLNEVILPDIIGQAEKLYSETLGKLFSDTLTRLDELKIPDRSGYGYAPMFTRLELEDGSAVELDSFGCFVLLEGTAKLKVLSGEVIDIAEARVCADGEMLTPGKKYFAAEDSGASVRIYSEYAEGMADGYYKITPPGELPAEEAFLDVSAGHWAAEYIFSLASRGIVNGVGGHMFDPEGQVTRAEFVTILGRMYAREDAEYYSETGFDDADIDLWYGPYVAWAADKGIVTGYDDGSFKPAEKITREQMALIMQRAAPLAGRETDCGEGEGFSDGGEVSFWAAEAVNWAQATGLMNGRGENRFEPRQTATRAETCAVLFRFDQTEEN